MKKSIFLSLVCLAFVCNTVFSMNFYYAQIDCNEVAIGVQDAYMAQGYSHADAYQHGSWAYDGCVGNGGSAGDSLVTIN